MSEPECCLGLNPDVTGIGVRVALYIQIVLGYGVSLVWPDTFARNARTAYMTAIALIIAALIQYKTQAPQELSLLDAIVVSMITTMMITFAISSGQTRSKVKQNQADANNLDEEVDPNASFSRFLTQLAFVGLWAGWCLNLWHDPLHFGFKGVLPDCNVNESVIIVLFGRNIKATDERMQKAALTFISIGIVLAFGSLWISLDQLLSPLINLFRGQLESLHTSRGRPDDEQPEDIILTVIRKILQGFSFATLIFLIVETEATIRRNDTDNSTKEWSYGQTIALILLLQQIMDLSSTYLEKMAERKERKERDEAVKNSAPLTPPTFTSGNPPIKSSPSPSPAPSAAPGFPVPQPAPQPSPQPSHAFPVPQTGQSTGAGPSNPR